MLDGAPHSRLVLGSRRRRCPRSRVLGFVVLQTAPNKRLIADFAGGWRAATGSAVRITGLTGFVPTSDARHGSHARRSRRHLRHHRRPRSHLAALGTPVRGRVDIERLAADRITFERMPNLPPAAPATDDAGSPIPRLRVVLGELDVKEIALSEAVAELPATLSIVGSARLVDPTETG